MLWSSHGAAIFRDHVCCRYHLEVSFWLSSITLDVILFHVDVWEFIEFIWLASLDCCLSVYSCNLDCRRAFIDNSDFRRWRTTVLHVNLCGRNRLRLKCTDGIGFRRAVLMKNVDCVFWYTLSMWNGDSISRHEALKAGDWVCRNIIVTITEDLFLRLQFVFPF